MNAEQIRQLRALQEQLQRDLWQFTGKTLVYIGTLRAEPETRTVGLQLQQAANVAQAALIAWRKLFRAADAAGFPDKAKNETLIESGRTLHAQLVQVLEASDAKIPGMLMRNLSRVARVAGEVSREVVAGVVAGGQEMIRGLAFIRRNWWWMLILGGVAYLAVPAITKAAIRRRPRR